MAITVDVQTGSIADAGGVLVEIGGLTASQYYSVKRSTASGHYAENPIRGYVDELSEFITLDRAQIDETAIGVLDFTAPMNETWTYTVERYLPGDLFSPIESVSDTGTEISPVPTGLGMISDPFSLQSDTPYIYSYNVTGSITDFRSVSRSSNSLGSHHVLGRKNPVVVMDVMGGATGTIVMTNICWYTYPIGGEDRTSTYDVIDRDETSGWNTIFEDGRTLLFRSHWKDTGIDDFYFKPTSIEIARAHPLAGNYSGSQTPRQYTIDFVEVDGFTTVDPADVAPTWATVANNNADWAEVEADHTDWADVLANPAA